MFLFVIPIFMGLSVATQTAVNSRLGKYTRTPFMASAISFLVGAIFLLIIMVFSKIPLGISGSVVSNNPWWLWIVGFTGAFGLTVNVLLFPRLGGVQTAVLPVMGQILAGIIVDQFGLFYSPISKLTVPKFLGLLMVIAGMFLVVAVRNRKNSNNHDQNPRGKLGWQLLGITAGIVIGIQTAINGRLGTVLHSPVKATFVAFGVGAIVLIVITFFVGIKVSERIIDVKNGIVKGDWWIALGGVFGSLYVLLASWLVPLIGTGQVIVIALFGQLLFSAVIDSLGLFHSVRRPITLWKTIGLVVMLVGVCIIRFI